MKIAPRQIASFLKNPDPAVQCILLYGPDNGLVKERADQLTQQVVADPKDPFLVADLGNDVVKGDPARLGDEAAAMALTGGRRVVRIYDADDGIAATFKDFLKEPVGDALIVVSAGDLAAKSKLRQAFEGAKTAGAAIPCYADDNMSLDGLIRSVFKERNIRIDEDAVQFLNAHLGADRGLSRGELEKLALYAGEGGKIALEDAVESVGDSSAYSIDTVVYAAAEGDSETLDRTLGKLWEDGTNAVALLRSMTNHVIRLQQVMAQREAGKPLEAAIKGLRPPIFWKLESRFKNQLSLWNKPLSAMALKLLLQAEVDCKRTGIPDRITCARCLQQIAAVARRQRRR